MSSKPRNFSQAIDELEDAETSNVNEDLRARLEKELHRIEETLKTIKPHLEDISHKVGDEAKKAKDKVEGHITQNPWAAVGIAGIVFFLLGFLLGFTGTRRRD